ncbi:restriction endonuclease subunit S [Polyangium jinanense]|uniref:restriction endonuclease subunit S n=1 Tax=Polyangium jinanense TaxID=2829994 RepID=UPI002341DB82|nr:restriction endonuclease subunit S [Polyangium jinanense]MDC3957423.1 restriction endonuclease subunit S [Polyangium jinanense]
MSDVPTGWTTVRVGDACHLINGRAFKPTDWTSDGLPIVRIQNLNSTQAKFNLFNGHVEHKHLIDSGELLFAWSGTPGTSFGAHIWDRGKAVLNQHIFRVLFDEREFDKRFLRHAINDRLEHLIGVAHGGAGLAHVTKPVFEATEILKPPLAEQRRIVSKIESLTARSRRAKEALDAVPDLLEQFRQSVLAAAFRGDLTAAWREKNPDVEPAEVLLQRIRAERRRRWEEAELAKMRTKGKMPGDDRWKAKYEEPEPVDASELPELPEGWAWASVGEVVESLKNGIATKPDQDGGLAILRISAVRPMRVNTSDVRYLAPSDEFGEYELVPGDVLFTRYNGNEELVGVAGMVRDVASALVYPDKLIRARVLRSVIAPEFFEAATNAFATKAFIETKRKSAAGQVGISGSDLRIAPIPVAPLAEQLVMARAITRMIALADAIERNVEDVESQRTALDRAILSKAFRGELVPQDPTDEPASLLLDRLRAEATDPTGKKPKRGKRHAAAAAGTSD